MSQGDFRDYMTVAKATGPAVAPPVAARGRPSSWLVVFVVAVVVVLTALALVGLRLRTEPRDDRPIVLPVTFAGVPLGPAEHQFDDAGWRTSLREVFGDHPYVGSQYGTVGSGLVVNVVAVRMDASDESDAGLARPPFAEHGSVRCSHTVTFPVTERAPESTIEGRLLICYRAAPTLTVSALVLVGADRADTEETVARAVDEVWAQNA